MKIKSLPVDERPIEKSIYQGISHLSNAELIAVILGSGYRDKSAIGLAEDVLALNSNGISYLSDCTVEELTGIKGMGIIKSSRLVAAVELGNRISSAPKPNAFCISCADDVAKLFMEDMRYSKREIFKVLLLNAKGEIISVEVVSIGELTSTLVHPREVFTQAVKKSAASVIFVHNHPSGDPTPSEDDLNSTKALVEAGKLLRIMVLDHLIIGDGRYLSLKTLGYI